MKPFIGTLALVLALFAGAIAAEAHDRSKHATTAMPPHAQTADEGEQPYLANDKLFLWRLHWINHSEIQAGGMARSQGHGEGVADFGEQLVLDHRRMESELTALAQKKNIELQLTSDEYRALREPLSRQMTEAMDLVHEKGAEFDRQFLTHMADGHLAAIDLMRTYRAKTTDPDIRAFIDKGLSSLQEHHRVAESLLLANRGDRQDVRGVDEPVVDAGVTGDDKQDKKKKKVKGGSSSSKSKKVKHHDEPESGTEKQEEVEQEIEERFEPQDHPIEDVDPF